MIEYARILIESGRFYKGDQVLRVDVAINGRRHSYTRALYPNDIDSRLDQVLGEACEGLKREIRADRERRAASPKDEGFA